MLIVFVVRKKEHKLQMGIQLAGGHGSFHDLSTSWSKVPSLAYNALLQAQQKIICNTTSVNFVPNKVYNNILRPNVIRPNDPASYSLIEVTKLNIDLVTFLNMLAASICTKFVVASIWSKTILLSIIEKYEGYENITNFVSLYSLT